MKYLRIGDFSNVVGISVKTIRFYEEKGLIKPAYIDKYTGYRYYDEKNIEQILMILQYKNMGFTLEEIKNNTADFQLLEVMACPGGCVNGGGQPSSYTSNELRSKRAEGLYEEDRTSKVSRKSHENQSVKALYDKYLEKPGSHKAHELLHTTYEARVGYND